MNRRAFLAAGAVSVAGLSGCLGMGGGSGDSKHKSEEGNDTKEVDEHSSIPLAPLSDTHEWYKERRREVRGRTGEKAVQDVAHQGGGTEYGTRRPVQGDPVDSWSKDQKIVCYCGCPHHLSSIRAATLLDKGYKNVFVIDEGFWAWHERGYPISGKIRRTSR